MDSLKVEIFKKKSWENSFLSGLSSTNPFILENLGNLKEKNKKLLQCFKFYLIFIHFAS